MPTDFGPGAGERGLALGDLSDSLVLGVAVAPFCCSVHGFGASIHDVC